MGSIKLTDDKKVKVGQTFKVSIGGTLLDVFVVEDRGNLGPGGSRLVRVEVASKKKEPVTEPEQFEIPVGSLVPA